MKVYIIFFRYGSEEPVVHSVWESEKSAGKVAERFSQTEGIRAWIQRFEVNHA